METTSTTRAASPRSVWTGRILSTVAALFLAFDGAIKMIQLPEALEGSASLGFTAESVLWIGIVEVAALALYLYPRTAYAGAVLLTGFLGGAVATHVRMASPLATHTFFPLYLGALVWAGLLLRHPLRQAFAPASRQGDATHGGYAAIEQAGGRDGRLATPVVARTRIS